MRFSRIALSITALFLFLAAAEPAHASQLHVTYLGMAAIAQQGGLALVTTVLSVQLQGKRKKVTARVEEVWPDPQAGEANRHFQSDADLVERCPYLPGKNYQFAIYEGVEWTSPNESPMDFRVCGSIPVDSIQPQDRVVAVNAFQGWELLPWNSEVKRKLEVFFTEDGTESYVENTSIPQLEKDLADKDFFALARKTLIDRNALTPEILLRAARHRVRPYHMLTQHFDALSDEERTAFVHAAAKRLSSNPHPHTLRDLIDVVDRFSTKEEYREAKRMLLMALVTSSHAEQDMELADWFVQRFSEWLPREQRVLLDPRSDSEFLDWYLSKDPQERQAALLVAKQMEEQRRAELLSRLLWGDRVREDQTYGEAVASLAVLVPEAGPILAPHLRNNRAWRAAASGLVAVGRPAVPSLCALIEEFENPEIRGRGILVLQLIGPGAGEAVPHLVDLLENPALLPTVVAALGAMGPAADEAVPALECASAHVSRKMRREIAKALQKIGAGG
jgi:hypothetical protein